MAIRACAVLLAMLVSGALSSQDACALDNATRDRILASQTRLAAALMMRISSDPTVGAVLVSPASIAGMLSPLVIAGDETHRSAMAGVLQLAPAPTRLDDLDALHAIAATGTPGGAVEMATRYVFSPRSPPTAEAAGRLAQAGVEAIVAEPTSNEAGAENDAWVSKVTHGKITNVNPPPPNTILAALNALYFKDRWTVPFEVSATAPADFHTADGARVRTPFMHSSPLQTTSREDARFVAVEMSFADVRYAIVVLTTKNEPADLASFADHLAWLDGQQFQTGQPTVVDIPRFKATSHQGLLPALVDLGLDPSQSSAGLTTDPVLLVEVTQTVKLEIDEEGAEVAAVTEGYAVTSGRAFANVSEVIVDKPFAYALRDRQTGLVIAAGFVSSVEGEKLAQNSPAKAARSHSVLSDEDVRAMQQARAAALESIKSPLSQSDFEARLRAKGF